MAGAHFYLISPTILSWASLSNPVSFWEGKKQ
jgi:hypothetical protein